MLSIIIPTHNRNEQLALLLQSIYQQSLPKHQYEVLVVCNLESLTTERLIESFQEENTHCLVVGRIGVNRARNLGIRKAKFEILCFLDDDCILHNSNYLQKIIRAHEEYPQTTAIGGRYIPSLDANILSKAYHKICDDWLTHSILDNNLCTNLVGGNVSYKRSHLIPKYFFQDNIVFGGAETELHQRLFSNDLELRLLPTIPVIHNLKISLKDFLKKSFLQGLNERRSEIYMNFKKIIFAPAEKSNCSYTLQEKLYMQLFQLSFKKGRDYASYESRGYSNRKIITFILWQDLIAFLDIVRPKNFLSNYVSCMRSIRAIRNNTKTHSFLEK